MIIRANQAEIDSYFNSPALGQSTLKKIIDGPQAFMENLQISPLDSYYQDKGNMNIGSAVDAILHQTEEEFENKFYYAYVNKPGDKALKISHLAALNENPEHTLEQKVLIAATEVGYRNTWSNAAISKNLKEAGVYDYVTALNSAKGKKIITPDERAISQRVADSLLTHENTAKYFTDQGQGINTFFQKPLYFTYKRRSCKGLPDIRIVDHNAKTIQLFDLKTTELTVKEFSIVMKKFRYDIQAAWYTLGANLTKPAALDDYTVLPFKFIVESTTNIGFPMVFRCSDEIVDIGLNGKPEYSQDYQKYEHETRYSTCRPAVHGVKWCMNELAYYEENGFDYSRDYVNSGGEAEINWSKITY